MFPFWYVAPVVVLGYAVLRLLWDRGFQSAARRWLLTVALNAWVVAAGILWFIGLDRPSALVFSVTGMAMLVHPYLLLKLSWYLQPAPRWATPAVVTSTLLALAAFGLEEMAGRNIPAWGFVALVVLPYLVAVAALSRVPHGLRGPGATRQHWGALSVGGIALITIVAALIRRRLVPSDAAVLLELGGLLLAVGTWLSLVPPKAILLVWRQAAIESIRLTLPATRPDMTRAELLDEAVEEATSLFLPGHVVWRAEGMRKIVHLTGSGAAAEGAAEIWRMPLQADGPTFELRFDRPRLLPAEDHAMLEGVVSVVALRLQAQDWIRSQQERLADIAAANRVKSEFLRSIGHELGNPLSPIRLQTALLRRTLPATAHASLDVIDRNTERLARLIQNMKDVAALEDGRLALAKEVTDLKHIVEGAVMAARPMADEKDLELRVDLAETQVEGDPGRLDQVVGNLLSNAIKYTPAGGVGVTLRVREGAAVLEVADSGLGMTKDQLAALGTLYERFHPDAAQGTGLGVHITKALVKAQGGELLFHSDGPGRGTTATVRLPLVTGSPGTPDP